VVAVGETSLSAKVRQFVNKPVLRPLAMQIAKVEMKAIPGKKIGAEK
jgi:hypothetical protein